MEIREHCRFSIIQQQNCLAWLLTVVVLFPAFIYGQEIRYAMELNNIPVQCRSVAMGGTGVALIRDGTSSFWNPALPAYNLKYELAIEGARLYSGLSDIGVASFSCPVQKGLSIGALYTGLLSGDIEEHTELEGDRLNDASTRANGNDATGIFHDNQHRFQVFVAKLFPIPLPRPAGIGIPLPVDVGAGLNFKYYWQTMTPSDDIRMAMNVNLDFGAALSIGVDYDMTKELISRRILIGIAIRDFLPTKVTWLHSPTDYSEPVNSTQFYGISYIDNTGFLKCNWTATIALHKVYETSIHAGIEAEFLDLVSFRCGVADRSPAFGAGIRTDIFRFDYAISFDELAVTPLRLSMGFSF